MSEMHIVLPPVSNDEISNGLRHLSGVLGGIHPENQSYGLLGGEDGYGNEYENDIFLMFPFYWGDCLCGHDSAVWEWEELNRHSDTCWTSTYHRITKEKGYLTSSKMPLEKWKALGWWKDDTWGIAVACTCGHSELWQTWQTTHDHDWGCPTIRPNFLYKPSGFRVDWYKYIGRGMEHEEISPVEWAKVLTDCLGSL